MTVYLRTERKSKVLQDCHLDNGIRLTVMCINRHGGAAGVMAMLRIFSLEWQQLSK